MKRVATWRKNLFTFAAAALGLAATPAMAINIAAQGYGITGNVAADNGTLGVMHDNAGGMGNVNDGNTGTRVDTFGGGGGVFDFTGVLFPGGPVNGLTSVTLRHAIFIDGGWYGPTAPPPSGTNLTGRLTAPKVQVTTDLGKTWTDVANTNDYVAVMNNQIVQGGANLSATTTFNLNTAANGVNGVRLLGDGGGTVDGNGFLGVFEMSVEANNNAGKNLGRHGYGIIGNVAVDDGSFGNLLPHAGAASNVNDGNTSTQSDTFSGTGGLDFGGVILPFTANNVTGVTLVSQVFGDGGWFGGGLNQLPLQAANITAPKVQATKDFGKTWFDVPSTDDYVARLTGALVNNPSAPATFTFNQPVSGVNGFRVLGDGGGTADGTGFIGVTEFGIRSSHNTPSNVNQLGIGITGITGNAAVDNGSLGVIRANAGVSASVVDRDVTTRVDTFGGGSDPFDFVGMTFASPVNDLTGVAIQHAIFFDGGWFGAPGNGPGSGGRLGINDLAVPKVQVTFDGITWVDVPSTNNYLEMLLGQPLPAVDFGAPTSVTASFSFAPQAGVLGVRLFGQGGGAADGNGFLGVFEFSAVTGANEIPEPASAMLAILGVGALALRRRRAA